MYEISRDLEHFYYAYCARRSIFGNCKKMKEIKINFDDKGAIKRLKNSGFVLRVRREL